MMEDAKDKKIAELDRQVKTLLAFTSELSRRVAFLERENNRRRSDVNSLHSQIRKG